MERPKPHPLNRLLKEKYGLHATKWVENSAQRTESRSGEKIPQNPLVRIENHINRFNEITNRKDPRQKARGIEAVKQLLHKEFVIKPDEIPKSYWDSQRQILRERGQDADLELIGWEIFKKQNSLQIVDDQRKSLDNWIDYLSSSDIRCHDALKYWALRSVLSMSEYDKKTNQYPQRSKGTTKPFPEVNPEALAYVVEAVDKKYSANATGRISNDPNLAEDTDPEFEKLLQGENFAKLYSHATEKFAPSTKSSYKDISGKWISYTRGTDPTVLLESIQRKGTGWCIRRESTAKKLLSEGDIKIFFSNDADGKSTIPRAAIRMIGMQILEVRGVEFDQNLDRYITPVVEQKLAELFDGEKYQKRLSDMMQLTEIDHKTKSGESLSPSELRFLYELNGLIEGFGLNGPDPRIEEIRGLRNTKEDLSRALNIPKEKISTTKEEGTSGDSLFHWGNIIIPNLKSAELRLPARMKGSLSLGGITDAKGLILPQEVSGTLHLPKISSPDNLILPQRVGNYLYLFGLKSTKDLKLPESVGAVIYLNNIPKDEKNELRKQHPNLKII